MPCKKEPVRQTSIVDALKKEDKKESVKDLLQEVLSAALKAGGEAGPGLRKDALQAAATCLAGVKLPATSPALLDVLEKMFPRPKGGGLKNAAWGGSFVGEFPTDETGERVGAVIAHRTSNSKPLSLHGLEWKGTKGAKALRDAYDGSLDKAPEKAKQCEKDKNSSLVRGAGGGGGGLPLFFYGIVRDGDGGAWFRALVGTLCSEVKVVSPFEGRKVHVIVDVKQRTAGGNPRGGDHTVTVVLPKSAPLEGPEGVADAPIEPDLQRSVRIQKKKQRNFLIVDLPVILPESRKRRVVEVEDSDSEEGGGRKISKRDPMDGSLLMPPATPAASQHASSQANSPTEHASSPANSPLSLMNDLCD